MPRLDPWRRVQVLVWALVGVFLLGGARQLWTTDLGLFTDASYGEARVVSVDPGGAADRARIRVGDRIVGVMTVFDDDHHLFEALRAGACGYLLKDEIVRRLVDGLRDALEGGAPMSPIIARRVFRFAGMVTRCSLSSAWPSAAAARRTERSIRDHPTR